MEKQYSCPLCGRMLNRRGKRFRDPSQVEAHIDGSHDGAHQEERGSDHREQIEENAQEVEEAEGSLAEPEAGVSAESVEVVVAEEDGEQLVEEMSVPAAVAMLSHQVVGGDGKADAAFTMIEEAREEREELRSAVEELYAAVEHMVEQGGGEVDFDHRESTVSGDVVEGGG